MKLISQSGRLKNIFMIPKEIIGDYADTVKERLISGYLCNLNKNKQKTKLDNSILIQCVEDIYYLGLFGQIITTLKENNSFKTDLYLLNSVRTGEFKSIMHFILYRVINHLSGKKWIRLYRSFCNKVGYKSTGKLTFILYDIADIFRSYFLWKNIKNKEELNTLIVNGIAIGDLVNDTYLRFKPSPTIEIDDKYLWRIIWQALRDIRRASKYFKRIKPIIYLTSYSTYIQHGIAVRVALLNNVNVYAFGNYQELSKKLSNEDWYHTKETSMYKMQFEQLEDQEAKLKEAEILLLKRLSGEIDDAISYMKQSAYIKRSDIVPDVHGKLIIFLHDFYDSPHIYSGMIFTDFWEWITYTIDTLKESTLSFMIKPHPNQIDINDSVIQDLIKKYPDISLISPDITNKQLVSEGGMRCAVTVYGTVAHEMAYFGVPTIACANHPHISFNFCKTAKTKDEYQDLLCNYKNITFNKVEARKESLMFYYMHNLNHTMEEKRSLEAVSRFRSSCGSSASIAEELPSMLSDINDHAAFKEFINTLEANINDINYTHS